MTGPRAVNPPAFAPPRGYANGVIAEGTLLAVAGQIGCDPATMRPVVGGFAAQFAKALDNVLAVVREAGGGPGDVTQMTVYVTDLGAYRASRRELGPAWKARFGDHYPAMALVGVSGLVEPGAEVEISALAVLAGPRVC